MPVPASPADVGSLAGAAAAFGGLWLGSGWLIGRRAVHGCDGLDRLAMIGVLGLGSTVIWNQLCQALGASVRWPALLIWLAVSALLGTVAGRATRPAATRPRPVPNWCWWALGGLAAAVCALWLAALTGPRLTPDQVDNTRHGFFVARIVDTGSNRPADVLVDDLRSGEASAVYYPLTLHSTAAVVADATGLSIPAVLGGQSLAAVVAIGIPSMAAVARRLSRGDPAVAVAGAVLGTVALPFPAELFNWGALPMLVAMLAVPSAAVAVTDWTRGSPGGSPWSAALASVAVVGLHTTQIVVLVAVAVALAPCVVPGPATATGRWRRVTALVALALALVPLEILGAVRGARERVAADEFPLVGAARFARQLVTFGLERPVMPALAVVATVGGALLAWRTPARRWVVLVAATCVLGALAAQSHDRVTALLTLPWYGFAFRLAATTYLLAAPLTAWGVVWALRRAPRPPIAAGLLVLMATPQLSVPWLSGFQDRSSVGSDELAAFAHLAGVHREGTAVLTDERDDGGLWLYTLHRVTPLFGFPVEYHEPGPEWSANLRLLHMVADPASSPREVERLAGERCVEYVLAADHPNLPAGRALQRAQLRTAPFLTEVFSRPTVSVFRIDGLAELACGPQPSEGSGR